MTTAAPALAPDATAGSDTAVPPTVAAPEMPVPVPHPGPADLVVGLAPGTIVVERPDGTVQVGLAPDRAVVVEPVACGPRAFARLLHTLREPQPLDAAATRCGLGLPGLAPLAGALRQLVDLGHLRVAPRPSVPVATTATPASPAGGPVRRVHVLGSGPVAHSLRGPLQVNGCRIVTGVSPGLSLDPAHPPWRRGGLDADLVVLTDEIVPDPLLTGALVAAGIRHLHVHCREGRVVVGPFVVPGRTPCLRCTDLYRADRDPHWPRVAAQLLGVRGSAPVPALTAATALVLSDVSATRTPGGRPQTLGATVEVSPAEGLWARRDWPAHQRCDCGAATRARPLEE